MCYVVLQAFVGLHEMSLKVNNIRTKDQTDHVLGPTIIAFQFLTLKRNIASTVIIFWAWFFFPHSSARKITVQLILLPVHLSRHFLTQHTYMSKKLSNPWPLSVCLTSTTDNSTPVCGHDAT